MQASQERLRATNHLLILIRVDIGKGSANGNLVVPDLAEAIANQRVALVVPAVGIQADVELEDAVVVDGGGDVVLLVDLGAVEPDLEVAGAVRLPVDLEDDLVPHSRANRRKVGPGDDAAAAVGLAVVAVDITAVQLVALDPDHGGRHPVVVVTASTGAVGNELGEVVQLRALKVPRVGQTEHEAVEERVAARVAAVVDDLGVVAAGVARGEGLGHLDGSGALVDNVGDLRDSSLVLEALAVPAIELARVVKGLGGLSRWQESQDGGEEGLDSNHFLKVR